MSIFKPEGKLPFEFFEPGQAEGDAPAGADIPAPAQRDELLDGLVENAVDFLKTSVDEFDERPKYSVVHFAAAIELFFKARLLMEHWTLVVDRRKEPDRKKFEEGDFQSVTPEQAITLLKKVVGTVFRPEALSAFKNIRQHRNQIIHFHCALDDEPTRQKVVKEQCRALYHLRELLTKEWEDEFKECRNVVHQINYTMRRFQEYLAVVFEAVKGELEERKKAGVEFECCPACYMAAFGFESNKKLADGKCLVCSHATAVVSVECPECKKAVRFIGDSDPIECPHCGEVELDRQDIYAAFDESDPHDPARIHCNYCSGQETVLQIDDEYLCVECFETSKQLGQCDWCSDIIMAFDASMSNWKGCINCDGQWDKD
jgi:hypothetical protein